MDNQFLESLLSRRPTSTIPGTPGNIDGPTFDQVGYIDAAEAEKFNDFGSDHGSDDDDLYGQVVVGQDPTTGLAEDLAEFEVIDEGRGGLSEIAAKLFATGKPLAQTRAELCQMGFTTEGVAREIHRRMAYNQIWELIELGVDPLQFGEALVKVQHEITEIKQLARDRAELASRQATVTEKLSQVERDIDIRVNAIKPLGRYVN